MSRFARFMVNLWLTLLCLTAFLESARSFLMSLKYSGGIYLISVYAFMSITFIVLAINYIKNYKKIWKRKDGADFGDKN